MIAKVVCACCRSVVATVETDELQAPLRGDMLRPLYPSLRGHPLFSKHSGVRNMLCIKNAQPLQPHSHRITPREGYLLLEGGEWDAERGVSGGLLPPMPVDLAPDPALEEEWARREAERTEQDGARQLLKPSKKRRRRA